jgi:uncharacterized repeat protein (TIGR03803 family)
MAPEKLRIPSRSGVSAFVAAVMCVLAWPGAARAQAAYSVMHSFTGPDGAQPRAGLIQAADGNFYGTTYAGGIANLGTVFRMTTDGVATVLHSFTGGAADGAQPEAEVIQAADGNFYGTTYAGGTANRGTVFRMNTDGAVTVLHSFAGYPGDGANPRARLVEGADGRLYGTTYFGGTANAGTAFAITSDGVFTLLHSFTYAEGVCPMAALIKATDGDFYGTTSDWGACYLPGGGGTVFKMTVDGTVTVLHYFTAGADGGGPNTALVQAADGSLYGTSTGGYLHTRGWYGVIFRVSGGGFTPLVTMESTELIQAKDGNFYGTNQGGIFRSGIFRMTPAGVVTLLYSLDGGAEGRDPAGALVQAADGSFYGTASTGGAAGQGVVFRLTETPQGSMPLHADFDGDGKADLAVYRPNDVSWYIRYSSSNYSYADAATHEWGDLGDNPLVADFDGDRRNDLVVWRPTNGTWLLRFSSSDYSTTGSYHWGLPGDIPVAADVDGDGRSDLVVWRPTDGTWYVRFSFSNFSTTWRTSWGLPGDIPVVADLDGDRRSDLVVWRPADGTWYVRFSSSDYSTTGSYHWGLPGDLPVAADFDGDGRADLVVWRPTDGTWWVRFSASNFSTTGWTSWGLPGDMPIAADFDGDGKSDLVVWRPADGTWYVRFSSSGYRYMDWYQWGLAADRPL